jgi:hypothetical protein
MDDTEIDILTELNRLPFTREFNVETCMCHNCKTIESKFGKYTNDELKKRMKTIDHVLLDYKENRFKWQD